MVGVLMRLSSRLKLVKYWVKGRALSLSPAAYWKARRAVRGVWEQEIRLLPHLCPPGTVAIDVGAHFGMYTHELLQCGARIEAFEPIPSLAAILARGYRGDARVRVHEVALSDVEGEVELRVPRAGWGRSTIEKTNALDGRRDPTAPIDSVRVAMRTLDSFALSGVSFIKIDVEGHEVAMVRGALATLERERPALLIEMEERHCTGGGHEMLAALERLGYGCWQLDGQVLRRDRVASTNNYLFLQASHLEALARHGIVTA